jgi:hypothetical protein
MQFCGKEKKESCNKCHIPSQLFKADRKSIHGFDFPSLHFPFEQANFDAASWQHCHGCSTSGSVLSCLKQARLFYVCPPVGCDTNMFRQEKAWTVDHTENNKNNNNPSSCIGVEGFWLVWYFLGFWLGLVFLQ